MTSLFLSTAPLLRTARHLGLAASLLLAMAQPAAAQTITGTEPVKIFILAGESNMSGKGTISPSTTPGTLDYVYANDPTGKYQFLKSGGSYAVRNDVGIRNYVTIAGNTPPTPSVGNLTTGLGSNSGLIGPEFGFGHVTGDAFENKVLIVKVGVDAATLGGSFCPPSSRQGEPEPTASTHKGFYYKEIIRLVNEAKTALGSTPYEIVGLGWHQGYNDRVQPALSAAYETNMANFISDIRSSDKGIGVPDLRVVIATVGVDGLAIYPEVELAQLKMADPVAYPAFAGNVAVVDTRQNYEELEFWQSFSKSPANEGYHWNRNGKSYLHIGMAMGDAMLRLAPGRIPYRPRSSGGPGGATLIWKNGSEMPTSVRVLRNGVEIAAAAPANPPVFVDANPPLGISTYELQFAMQGDPAPPLTIGHNTGVTNLAARLRANGAHLSWNNNLNYAGIIVKRDNVMIATLPGSATSYVDLSPPAGARSYTVEPTTPGSIPTQAGLKVGTHPAQTAVIYEPFDMTVDTLLEKKTGGVGLDDLWLGGNIGITSGNLAFGTLPTYGNRLLRPGGNGSAVNTCGTTLADAGLLADGAVLWFSFLTKEPNNINCQPAFLLGNGPLTGYYNEISTGCSGIGVRIGSGKSTRPILFNAGSFSEGSVQSTIATGATALIVGKITWGATPSAPDTIQIYTPGRNLQLNSSPAPTSVSAVLDQSDFSIISMWGNVSTPEFDEIRFGATYDDVIGQGVDTSGDFTPPAPATMSFASPPAATSTSAITMTAATASDANGVQYYFDETSGNPGGTDSGWQDSPVHTDTGLDPNTQYTYTVQARDKSVNINTNTVSPSASATTLPPDTNPPPVPGFASGPAATSSSAVTMTATVVADPEGGAVEYSFTETSGNPGGTSSGWQSSPTYTDTGLSASTSYTYTVKARDTASPPNESAASSPASATTQTVTGPGGAVIYEPFDMPAGPLVGQPGGYGLSGNWIRQQTSDTNQLVVASPGMTYGTLSTAGNRVENGTTTSSRSNRVLTGSSLAGAGLLADGATLWFSILVEPVTSSNSTSGFALCNGNITYFDTAGIDGVGINIQNGSDLEYCAWKSGTTGTYLRSTAQADLHNIGGTNAGLRPHLVVGKITWGTGGGNDAFELFMPNTSLVQGSRKGTAQSINVDQSTFNRIVLYNQGGGIRFDEIRFGASYEAVIGQGSSGPGPLDHFAISAIPSPQTVGTPITGITLIAQDAANQTVTGFTGTVTFGGTGGFSGTSSSFAAGTLTGVSVTPAKAGSKLTLTVTDGSSGKTGSTEIATIRTQYDAWSGGATFDADANGDGVKNGLAFLLGAVTPTSAVVLPVASQSGGNLLLNFTARNDANRGAATLSVQHSSDLGIGDQWVSAPVTDEGAPASGVTFIVTQGSPNNTVQATISSSEATSGKLFGRLKATP